MEFQDKILKCIDCGADFAFTAGEQLFFHDKQFRNEPKRCKACKAKRVSVLGAVPSGNHRSGFSRVETRTTCSQCGKETTVPFRQRRAVPSSAANVSSNGGRQLRPDCKFAIEGRASRSSSFRNSQDRQF